jgi:hypothetical protein
MMIWSCVQAWGAHKEFENNVGLFQDSVATKYKLTLFACTINVFFPFSILQCQFMSNI